jgi:hypothetical protein
MFKKDKNKRDFERVDMTQACYFVPLGDFIKSDPLTCWINNISMGGVSIDVDKKAPLKEGATITVSYRLGEAERTDRVTISHTGVVINNLRCGCVFKDEDKERDHLISSYIKHIYMTYQ